MNLKRDISAAKINRIAMSFPIKKIIYSIDHLIAYKPIHEQEKEDAIYLFDQVNKHGLYTILGAMMFPNPNNPDKILDDRMRKMRDAMGWKRTIVLKQNGICLIETFTNQWVRETVSQLLNPHSIKADDRGYLENEIMEYLNDVIHKRSVGIIATFLEHNWHAENIRKAFQKKATSRYLSNLIISIIHVVDRVIEEYNERRAKERKARQNMRIFQKQANQTMDNLAIKFEGNPDWDKIKEILSTHDVSEITLIVRK